jgi:hypothetical protein
MLRDNTQFAAQLLDVKTNFVEYYYKLANDRKRGKNIAEPFNVKANLIGILDDNNVSEIISDTEKNLILDDLIWSR